MEKLEPEMYYSIKDLSHIFNLSKNQVKTLTNEKQLKPIRLLNRELFLGKTINQHIIGKKNNLNRHRRLFRHVQNYDENELITRFQCADDLDMQVSTFGNVLVNEYHLKATEIQNDGKHLYRVKDINDVIDIINNDRKFSFYPQLLDEDSEYYATQITQNLKINHRQFKELYIHMFDLQPIRIENVTGHNKRIIYSGRDINKISKKIRNM